jgi:hypothetical protein
MSVISTWVATPNRIRLIYDFLAASSSGEERERVEQLAGPSSLSKQAEDPEEQAGTTTVPSTISQGIALGLFLEHDGKLAARPVDRELAIVLGPNEAYTQMLEHLLLSPESPVAESQQTFATALSWFLCQSPRDPLSFSGSQVTRLASQLIGDDFFELRSVANWQTFCYWARALGYCTFLKIDDKTAVYADPSRAVARHLRQQLQKTGMRKASELPALLANATVFDGGSQRTKIQARFKESTNLPSRLSESLSLALLRLENANKISLTQLADGDIRALDLGDRTRSITHLERDIGL